MGLLLPRVLPRIHKYAARGVTEAADPCARTLLSASLRVELLFVYSGGQALCIAGNTCPRIESCAPQVWVADVH